MSSKLLSANEHGIDRILRVVLGVVLLSLVFVGPRTLWGLAGLVFLGTAAIGWCPIYALLGLSTRGRSSSSATPPTAPGGR